jgi:hypothetical protein
MKLTIRLSGVTHDNRQQLLARTSIYEPIELRRDYFNKHDRNATGVFNSQGEHLGWIPKGHAVQVAVLIDEGQSPSARILRKLGGNGLNYGLEVLVIIDKMEHVMAPTPEAASANHKDDLQVAFKKAHYFLYSEQNFHEAIHWYKVCFDTSSAVAGYYLGFLYQHGLGVKQDSNLAKHYYRLGAENGIADSAFNIAYMYLIGCGIHRDVEAALKWFQVAAEQEHKDACFNLAYIYEHGFGVAQNSVTAQEWLELAMDYGDSEAMDIFYEEREFSKRLLRTPFHELKSLSDQAEMRFFQNLFELHEQDIEFLHYSEELDAIDEEDNKMQKYLLLLQYYLKVEQESRNLRDKQREVIRSNCIPNYHRGQVDLFDASLLLDKWCDDMDLNRRKYVNAYRYDTMVEFLVKSLFKSVQTSTADYYFWKDDYLSVLSRAMINLAICYRNMNMFHDIPSSIARKGYGLAECAFVLCAFDEEDPGFQERLEASAAIYGFFRGEGGNDIESILMEKRNGNYTFYQKCTYLKQFFTQYYRSNEI